MFALFSSFAHCQSTSQESPWYREASPYIPRYTPPYILVSRIGSATLHLIRRFSPNKLILLLSFSRQQEGNRTECICQESNPHYSDLTVSNVPSDHRSAVAAFFTFFPHAGQHAVYSCNRKNVRHRVLTCCKYCRTPDNGCNMPILYPVQFPRFNYVRDTDNRCNRPVPFYAVQGCPIATIDQMFPVVCIFSRTRSGIYLRVVFRPRK